MALTAVISAAAAGLTSCGLINDDLEECRHEYRLRFKYDHTLDGGDAFAAQVKSVNAWAYDQEGKLCAVASDSGERLKEAGYTLPISLEAGTYDIVVWAGLESGGSFTLTTTSLTPAENDLNVDMRLQSGSRAESLYSATDLTPLFYGRTDDVELTAPEGQHTVQYIDVPLIKDTNRVVVTLSQLDGSPIGRGDFTVAIEASNSKLDWRNDVTAGPEFSYLAWDTMTGIGDAVVPATGIELTKIYSVLSELSVSRLMADRKPMLVITRNSDGERIASLDLVKYLLWYKGAKYKDMPDQEFLDRKDDWELTLFLDSNMSWDKTVGIYIENWAVVPPQQEEL